MKRDPAEVTALFQRWRIRTAIGFALLTGALLLAYLVFGQNTPTTDGSGAGQLRSTILKLLVLYAIFAVYYVVNWHSVKRSFLSGKSADDALKVR